MLTNRDWATFFWLGVIAAYVLWKPDVRRSLRAVMDAFLTPKIAVPFALFAAWMVSVVWVGAQLGAGAWLTAER